MDFLYTLQTTLQTWGTYLLNGWLVLLFILADGYQLILATVGYLMLYWISPASQRAWVLVGAVTGLLTVWLVPSPIPMILIVMVWLGLASVRFERWQPDSLRWSVLGGTAIYSCAALAYVGYLAFSRQSGGFGAEQWSGLLSPDEAGAVINQGSAFLQTIASYGLFAVLPLGYLGLLVKNLFVQPPMSSAPEQMMQEARVRGGTR